MSEKAVIYARYSSDSQRDASIDQQVKACRKYAEGLDLEVLRVYDDRALTGKTDKRPSFLRMIRDSAKQEFKYVIVYTLDRFSRNKYDSATYKHKLKENGVKVLSAMEHITDDPTGGLMETILEGFAQYYSDELSQKIHRGLEDNAEKCIINGSIPLGYRRGPDGHAQIVDEEAEIVREIFQRVANDEQLIRIIEDLNRRGLKTKHGFQWNRSSFNRILSNERYTGVYLYKNHRIEGGIPEIIDRRLFDSVQMKIATKKNARGSQKRRRINADTYLLTGKLFCGKCGNPMIGNAGTSKSGKLKYYYTCSKRKHDRACDKNNIRREIVENEIARLLMKILEDDELIFWMAEKTIEYLESSRNTEEMDELKRQLDITTMEKNNVMTAIKMGIITETTKETLLELEKKSEELSFRIRMIEADHKIDITQKDIVAWLDKLRNGDSKDRKYQEQLFDTFLQSAYVYDNQIDIICKGIEGENKYTIPLKRIEEEKECDRKSVRINRRLVHQPRLNKPLFISLRVCL